MGKNSLSQLSEDGTLNEKFYQNLISCFSVFSDILKLIIPKVPIEGLPVGGFLSLIMSFFMGLWQLNRQRRLRASAEDYVSPWQSPPPALIPGPQQPSSRPHTQHKTWVCQRRHGSKMRSGLQICQTPLAQPPIALNRGRCPLFLPSSSEGRGTFTWRGEGQGLCVIGGVMLHSSPTDFVNLLFARNLRFARTLDYVVTTLEQKGIYY